MLNKVEAVPSEWDAKNPNLQRVLVYPKTLTGVLCQQNKGVLDWGCHSFLAYGCQNVVVIVDTNDVQMFQTLVGHKFPVVSVKWSRENYSHSEHAPYMLKLVSADESGTLISWDVRNGTQKCSFSDGVQSISCMEWLSLQDACKDLVLVLHSPQSLILWNTDTGIKLWKQTFGIDIVSFAFDPFHPSRVALLSSRHIMLIDDFGTNKPPSSGGKQYYISSHCDSQPNDRKTTYNPKAAIKRVTRMLVYNEKDPLKENPLEMNLSDCFQICFSEIIGNCLMLVYPREIMLVDLVIFQTIGSIVLDKLISPLVRVYPCKQRDVIYCLQDNGIVSVRVRHNNYPNEDDHEIVYDVKVQTESLRVTKSLKPFGFCIHPISELGLCTLMSDGRLFFYSLIATSHTVQSSSSIITNPVYAPLNGGKALYPKFTLFSTVDAIQCYLPEDQVARGSEVKLRLYLTGLITSLSPPPFIIRMCPPLTTKNYSLYEPHVAVGTQQGSVQILNLAKGTLWKELNLFNCPVRGLSWLSLSKLIAFGYPHVGHSGVVHNDFVIADITTGKMTSFRETRGEEQPVEAVRVSNLRQYFILVFKDPKPFELWDLKTETLLREMPRSFPPIKCLEWSPLHSLKTLRKKLTGDISNVQITSSNEYSSTQTLKEHFVCTDVNGTLYHFIVDGSIIKDGSTIPPEPSTSGNITALCWKGDTLVIGDSDGNLHIWDLKGKVSRMITTHRGAVRKLKFAPGKGNHKLLLLYNDGCDVWDSHDSSLVSSCKCPRDLPKIMDIDWASSDKVIMACIDGCIRVSDINLKLSNSPVEFYDSEFFTPSSMAPIPCLALKAVLQSQPWVPEYILSDVLGLGLALNIRDCVGANLEKIPRDMKSYLESKECSIAERCLVVALLYGDESEIKFWMVAQHYLSNESKRLQCPVHVDCQKSISRCSSSTDVFLPTNDGDLLVYDLECTCHKFKNLDLNFDVLCENHVFRKSQIEKSLLYDAKRVSHEHASHCSKLNILLGQTDRAVQILLETDSKDDSFYLDSLRACLVATIRSSGASQSTIKLVATNLIANGKLWEGVELLCLIEKGLDACKYLMTYNNWNDAIWLAKSTLDYTECYEVMRRWIEHLSACNQKSRAVLVQLSQGQFVRTLELLHSLHCTDRAGLFLLACRESGALLGNSSVIEQQLFDNILCDYARQLWSFGLKSGAEFHFGAIGDRGKDVLAQLQTDSDSSFSESISS